MPDIRADFWMNEYITPWDIYAHGITKVLAYRRTAFQEMYIVETGAYGKALVLDGKWQSCTGDEFLYHEPLVHPVMLQHGAPQKVLILGGGEGATAREVLRWKTVTRTVMVDIDGDVVESCKQHLPEMHQQCFDDPRLEVVIDDALNVLDRTEDAWDVIISDLSDPIEEGPSFKLFTREYFEKLKGALAPGGAVVVQSGPVGPAEMKLHVRLAHTLDCVYGNARSYTSYVPTYASPWSFVLCADTPVEARPDPEAVDAKLADNVNGSLTMFDGQAFLGMLQLPKHLRQAIAEETQVYTLREPPKFFGKGVVKQTAPTQ
ncbi:MAG: hypothetical protein MI923_10910 [Phycisphaerales bacterium]|nr:hypothetical protein [Phycisphaerales bacterium]